MSAPDVSPPESVAEAVAPDAFDARPDAFGALAVDRGGPAGGRGSLGKTRRARGQAKDANAPSAEGPPGYLVVFGVVAVRCPIERRAVEELLPALRPVIDACFGTALDLASLTLTSPNEGTIREKVEAFVAHVARAPGEGALLVRGIGKKGQHRTHYHGLLLALDVPGRCNEWRSLAGAPARGAVARTITGWPAHRAGYDRRFLPNLAAVAGYAFDLLPPDIPPRDLAADVIASGALAAPWQASHAALEAPSLLALDGPGKASAKRRKCMREKCDRDLPAQKRSHAMYCSDTCRKAASDERTGRSAKRGRARGEVASAEPARRAVTATAPPGAGAVRPSPPCAA